MKLKDEDIRTTFINSNSSFDKFQSMMMSTIKDESNPAITNTNFTYGNLNSPSETNLHNASNTFSLTQGNYFIGSNHKEISKLIHINENIQSQASILTQGQNSN